MTRFLCPVCRREARKTLKRNIGHHLDSIRADVCPGSGLPWDTAVSSDPEFQGVQ